MTAEVTEGKLEAKVLQVKGTDANASTEKHGLGGKKQAKLKKKMI